MTKNLDDLFTQATSALIDLEMKQGCEENLLKFFEYIWPILEPGAPLVHGWPLEAVAAHLEAVMLGHIKRLLITIFPGSTKSSMTNVGFPMWCWLQKPYYRFISASYSEGLTQRDNLKCLRVLQSEDFIRLWGDRFKLTQPARPDKFENNKTGWKMATSVGGQLLGHRGDIILIDDPNSPQVESEVVRRSTNLWFREVVPTRLNDVQNSSIVVIQQRMHLDDVAGIAVETGEYTWLNVPMEYEPRIYVNGYRAGSDQIETFIDAQVDECEEVFWQDPRVVPDELAWPERFPRQEVEKLKKILGPTQTAAMLQQHPVPRGGAIIKTEWWQLWKEPKFPPLEFILATLDTAFTEKKTNDPSAMTIWGVTHDVSGVPRVLLLYAWEDWLGFNDLLMRVIRTCTVNPMSPLEVDQFNRDPRFPVDKLLIESKTAGISLGQEIARLCTDQPFGVELFNPDKYGDKIARLHGVEHLFASKCIWAPDRAYADKVIEQCASFPYGKHDEYVDCTTSGLRWLRDCGFMPTAEERLVDETESLRYRKRPMPLYPV
jgi:phage terminase large subunit-like protein